MKKLFILPIIILFISCTGYRKDQQVCSDMNDESFYMVRVFGPTGMTNPGALMIYKIPMKGINDKKVDSVNREADKYIENCKKYTEN